MKRIVQSLTVIFVILFMAGCIGKSGGDSIEIPVITPGSGSYTTEVAVTITCKTEGTDIWYTIDGSDPKTMGSTQYVSEMKFDKDVTIKAYASKGTSVSKVATAEFKIKVTAQEPIIPEAGIYGKPYSLEIPVVAGTKVRYTVDGTIPTRENGIEISTTTNVVLNGTTTVKAFAYKDGGGDSGVVERVYTVLEKAEGVNFSKSEGSYNGSIQLEMNTAAGGKIRYSLDGSEPDQNSTEYTAPIEITESKVVKARTYKDGFGPSDITTATYTIIKESGTLLNINSWAEINWSAGSADIWFYTELEANKEYVIRLSDTDNKVYGTPTIDGVATVYDSDKSTYITAVDMNSYEIIPPKAFKRKVWIKARAYRSSAVGMFYLKVMEKDELYTKITGTGAVYEHLETSGDTKFSLNNLSGQNVYFIFTNTDNEIATDESHPTITQNYVTLNKSKKVKGEIPAPYSKEYFLKSKMSNIKINKKYPQSGSSFITEFNKNPLKYRDGGLSKEKYKLFKSKASRGYQLEDSNTFNSVAGSNLTTTAAKLKKVVSANGKNLYIWVENDSWTGAGKKAFEVNQTMVDAMADSFLKAGDNNDIYEWVTKIAGGPWGTHNNSEYISDTNDIHILLEDIDRDNSTTGGVVGYFWAANNVKASSLSYSNEKLMFVVDSVMFAQKDGSGWEKSDFWPGIVISTLAHEFQHMIHFYQKDVLNNLSNGTETWLNEMASQCVEDLVANKINSDGPRGLPYNIGSAGTSISSEGRLPLYNMYNYTNIASWRDDEYVLTCYSASYAYGAYLMRNYGGAQFINSMIKNSGAGKDSVEKAISDMGYGNVSFEETLRKFGVANLLSDRTGMDVGYKYNTGDWSNSTISGEGYSLGAINLYNYYRYNTANIGPYIYSSFSNGVFFENSNTYYLAGENITGSKEWYITGLSPNVKLSVVVK